MFRNIALKLLILTAAFSVGANAEKFTFVTEDLPPLQIEHINEKPTGALVDLIELLIQETQLDAEIKIYPWARSYDLAMTTPNTFIFSMLRSEAREKQFHWVGKLFTIRSYLAALKTRNDIIINDIEDAKHYTVGSIRHDLAEDYLLQKGFEPEKNLYVSAKYPVLWNMLYSKRTDIAFTNSIVWKYEIEKAGLNPSKLKLVYEVPDFASDLYLAASLSTNKEVINKLKLGLESIKADGRYDNIMKKWQLNRIN